MNTVVIIISDVEIIQLHACQSTRHRVRSQKISARGYLAIMITRLLNLRAKHMTSVTVINWYISPQVVVSHVLYRDPFKWAWREFV